MTLEDKAADVVPTNPLRICVDFEANGRNVHSSVRWYMSWVYSPAINTQT